MRFFQSDKFSYIIRKLNRINNFSLINDYNSYERFLKSTLTESFLTLLFLVVGAKFLVIYYNLIKSLNSNIIENKLDRLVEYLSADYESNQYFKNGYLVENKMNYSILNDSYFLSLLKQIEIKDRKILLVLNMESRIGNNSFRQKIYLNQHNSASTLNIILSLNNFVKFDLCLIYFSQKEKYLKLLSIDYLLNQSSLNSFKFDHFNNYISKLDLLLYFLAFVLFAFYYLVEELTEIYVYKKTYFKHLFNFIDLLILILQLRIIFIYSLLIYKNYTYDQSLFKYLQNDSEFENLCLNIRNFYKNFLINQEFNAVLIHVILIWIKMFKYINFSVGLSQMSCSLSLSFNHILSYLVIYAILVVAYAELMHSLYGQINEDYSTRIKSQFNVFAILLASIDFKFISNNSKTQIIFILFYILVYIIFSNIFLAIINDSYSFIVNYYDHQPELNYLSLFKAKFKYYINLLIDFKLKFNLNNKINLQENSLQALNLDNLKIKEFRKYLTIIGFDRQDVNLVFRRFELIEDFEIDDEIILNQDICMEVIRVLDHRKRANDSDSDIDSIYSSTFNLYDTNLLTINDEVFKFDPDKSEFITWDEYYSLKSNLEEIEFKLDFISNQLLEVYHRKKIREFS